MHNMFQSFLSHLSFIFIIFVTVQQSQWAIPFPKKNFDWNDPSSLVSKLSSMIEESKEAIDRFRCPEDWQIFGSSCYYLSNQTSRSSEASYTCRFLHFQNSKLIYLQRSVELFYVANIMTMNNISTSLIEIDPSYLKSAQTATSFSSNDQIKQQLFKKPNGLESSKPSSFGGSIKLQSLKNNHQDKFVNLDQLSNICDEVKWDVDKDASNIFLLNIQSNSDKRICSLNSAQPTIVYSHMCQYVLDLCFDNILCSKRGQCIKSPSGFQCSCYFLFTGDICEKWLYSDLQILFSIPLLIAICLLFFQRIQNVVRSIFGKPIDFIMSYFNREEVQNDTTDQQRPPFRVTEMQKRNRTFWLGGLIFIFFTLLFGMFIVQHWKLLFGTIDSLEPDSFVRNKIQTVEECADKTIFRVEHLITLFSSVILIVLFSFLSKQERGGILSPIDLFRITNRYTTAVMTAIQSFEIFVAVEGFLSEPSDRGVLVKLAERLFGAVIIGFRYYPILSSLQLRNIIVRFLALLYMIVNTIAMLYIANPCKDDFFSFQKFLSSEETNLEIRFNYWSIGFVLIKVGLYCGLLGYINAELLVRFAYDSIYIVRQNGRPILESPEINVEEFSFSIANARNSLLLEATNQSSIPQDTIRSNNSVSEQGYCQRFARYIVQTLRSLPDRIYIWDYKFRFTTIVICTYTLAYIILFHLTFLFIFIYTLQRRSYIFYLKHLLQAILVIDIERWSLQTEIMISAILTMIIYSIQLFIGIKNYKIHMYVLYQDMYQNIRSTNSNVEIAIDDESNEYPGFLIRYIFSGFLICFHFFVFIGTVLHVIITEVGYFRWTFQIIAPLVIMFILQKLMTKGRHTITHSTESRNPEHHRNAINRHSIIMHFTTISNCFIGFASPILYLTKIILPNILRVPSFDCYHLGENLENLDNAQKAYVSFLRMEITTINRVLLEQSRTIQGVPYQNSGSDERDDVTHPQTNNIDDDESLPIAVDTMQSLLHDDDVSFNDAYLLSEDEQTSTDSYM